MAKDEVAGFTLAMIAVAVNLVAFIIIVTNGRATYVQQWAAHVGIIAFAYWQWYNRPVVWDSGENIKLRPPNSFFPLIWTAIYGLVAGALVIILFHEYNATADQAIYVAYAITWVVSLSLSKLWIPSATLKGGNVVAFIVALMILLSAIVLEVLAIVQGAWITVALGMPYMGWLVVAVVINAQYAWMYRNQRMVTSLDPQIKELISKSTYKDLE